MGLFDSLRSIIGKTTVEPAVAPGVPQRPQERRARNRVDAREGTRALIIDDSPTIVVALRKILGSAGYVVLEALDAEQGIELARSGRPELIFLDIVLPGMNGFAALRHLRRDPATREIPVIMISGNEQATEQFFGTRIGADDFMKKPFSRLEVFARIERLLDEQRVPRRPLNSELGVGNDSLPPVPQPAAVQAEGLATGAALAPAAPAQTSLPEPAAPAVAPVLVMPASVPPRPPLAPANVLPAAPVLPQAAPLPGLAAGPATAPAAPASPAAAPVANVRERLGNPSA